MAKDNSTFKNMVDMSRELLEINLGIADGDEKRFQNTLNIAQTLEDVVANQTDSNALMDISLDLEDQLMEAKMAGNTELIREIGLINSVIKAKKKENQAQDNINSALVDAADKVGLPGSQLKGLYDTLNSAGGKQVGQIMMIAAAIGMVIGLIKAMADVTDEVGTRFGAVGVKNFKSDIISAKAEAVALGYGMEEASQTIETLSHNFSIGFGEATNMAGTSMDIAKALGIGVDTSAKLIGQMMTIGGHSAESAANQLKMTTQLAASKGVAPGVVMQDMAESSEAIAAYSKDGGVNMHKAAVQARQMGLTLADTAGIMDNLLDFQSSLQKELEASVLVGKQMNFQKARELALNNDIEGAMDAVLDQLGSEAEWNNMNAIQRKAVADSIGVGVDKMSQMVEFSGKTNEELARMGKSIKMSDIASDEAMSSISAMMFAFQSLGTHILAGIASVFEFFDSLFEGGGVVGVMLLGLVVIAGMVALWMGAMYLSGLAAGWGLTAAGGGATAAAPGFAALGTAGMIAVPVLFAIALIGLSLVGIIYAIGYVLKQLPPIITALAQGFVLIAEAITNSILQLVKPEVIAGVYLLAGGFFFLAMSLAALAYYGLMALPALAGVALFAAGMTAMGFSAENITKIVMGGLGSGSGDEEKVNQMEKDIAEMKGYMKTLVTGFGEGPNNQDYIKGIGKASGNKKVIAELGPAKLTV